MKKKRGVKKINFFKENYSKSWVYIKESKNFIWAAIFIFFIATIIGFLYQPPWAINWVIEQMKKALADTIGMNASQLISYIFLNNIQGAFMGILFGFALGAFPLLVTLLNGYVVGYVCSSAVSSSGISSLLNLLPHGIFELPAIFISFGMGIKFGTFIFYKEKLKYFNKFFINSLRVLIFVILPLLIIAAIIEGSLISILK